jgi:hypothetical protein
MAHLGKYIKFFARSARKYGTYRRAKHAVKQIFPAFIAL